jgi:hypothetical protein
MSLLNKSTGTDAKLWIIGDSFAGMSGFDKSWQYQLYSNFIGKHIYVSSRGSRDIQTIFDIFLRNLYRIKPNDFVILMFPTLSRFRLPLKTPYMDVEWSNTMELDKKDGTNTNSFIGNLAYRSIEDIAPIGEEELHKQQFELEFPLNTIEKSIFQPNDPYKQPNFANITQMINCSNVIVNNWNSILKSIKSYVSFNITYYSWTNELDSSFINTKDIITKECGMWHTLHDEFIDTNGKAGVYLDGHWSENMNIKFAEHIIKNYPQYFKYESKII